MKKRNIIIILILAILLSIVLLLVILNFVFGNFLVKYTSNFFNVADCELYTPSSTNHSKFSEDYLRLEGCDEAWQCDFLYAKSAKQKEIGLTLCNMKHGLNGNVDTDKDEEQVFTMPAVGSYSMTGETITEETDLHEININYPLITGSDNAVLAETVNQEIKKHIEVFKTNFELAEGELEGHIKNSLTMTYINEFGSDEILSIYFDVYEYYSGAAHGLSYVVPFNYDLVNQEVIYLSDMFNGTDYLNVLSKYSQDEFMRFETMDDTWVKEGTAPDEYNFDSFTFSKTGLVFYFDPYQVASYADGVQQVSIPYNVLYNNTDIAQDSVLRLVKTNPAP